MVKLYESNTANLAVSATVDEERLRKRLAVRWLLGFRDAIAGRHWELPEVYNQSAYAAGYDHGKLVSQLSKARADQFAKTVIPAASEFMIVQPTSGRETARPRAKARAFWHVDMPIPPGYIAP